MTKENQEHLKTVLKIIMQDKNLSIRAKAIYAYLWVLVGRDWACSPPRKKIQNDLGISSESLNKYLRELIDAGHITREQTKVNGRFSRNIYKIKRNYTICALCNKQIKN